jgi:hypothetical protein
VALFGRTSTIIMDNVNYFLVILDLKTGVNVQDTVSVFLLFFSRYKIHKIVVQTNHHTEQFMNSRVILFTFRSLVRQ